MLHVSLHSLFLFRELSSLTLKKILFILKPPNYTRDCRTCPKTSVMLIVYRNGWHSLNSLSSRCVVPKDRWRIFHFLFVCILVNNLRRFYIQSWTLDYKCLSPYHPLSYLKLAFHPLVYVCYIFFTIIFSIKVAYVFIKTSRTRSRIYNISIIKWSVFYQ